MCTNNMSSQFIVPSATNFKRDPSTLAAQTEESTALTLLTALKAAGVKFIRYSALDCSNGMRCKAVPIDRLIADPSKFYSSGTVGIAEVVFAGAQTHADHIVEASGLSSARILSVSPDIASLRILPYNPSTAMVLGTLHDQRTGKPSPLCTRHLLQRVKQASELQASLAFTVGIELEFCLFQNNSDKPVDVSRYGNSTTLNDQQSFIDDLYDQLQAQSIDVEQIHSESAPGQVEVVLSKQDDVVRIADHVVLARDTIQCCAKQHNLRACFLPKIFPEEAGNGMHIHMSFRDLMPNARSEDKYNAFRRTSVLGQISNKGSAFLEGILSHLPALLSVTIPSANSFRRVGPGCWTGSSVGWAVEEKESPLRVCIDHETGGPSNVELKLCDSSANVYLSLALLLSAGLDGIAKKLPLRPELELRNESAVKEPLPATLQESLDILKKDTVLLNIMGKELSKGYIAVKEDEASHGEKMSLEDEIATALQNL